MSERVAVIGLGYVGLPVALAFARKFPGSIGFDINVEKVKELRSGFDRTGEIAAEVLKGSSLEMTWDLDALKPATFYVVAVPTPVDLNNRPDLTPVIKAS
jgi:UDP-N-acetyl-D-galactosamine dehydrogenase